MLYLFNSGFRLHYARNVLNTLFLPKGATNEYRYRRRASNDGTSTPNINPASIDAFRALKLKDRGVVVFADRFADNGYFYHPLRFVSFVTSRESNDYMFFRMRMHDFVYPRNPAAFNETFRQNLHPQGVVQLTQNDPKNMNDGWYALSADSLFADDDEFLTGQQAWTSCVERLSICQAFSGQGGGDEEPDDGTNREVVFVSANLRRDRDKEIKSSLADDHGVFELIRGERYELDLSYRYPIQADQPEKRALLSIQLGENLKPLDSNVLNIDSYSNSVIYQFTTKRHLEDYLDSVSFDFVSPDRDIEIVGTDSKVRFQIRESKGFWLQFVLALLFFCLVSTFMAADSTTFSDGINETSLFSLRWKFGAGLVQAGVLFWLFKLVGKRFM